MPLLLGQEESLWAVQALFLVLFQLAEEVGDDGAGFCRHKTGSVAHSTATVVGYVLDDVKRVSSFGSSDL